MLRTPREFAALQQSSKSKVHPLLVARFAPNDLQRTRFGLSTGRRLGSAVVRNRVRRRLRDLLRALGPDPAPGWDVLIVARPKSAAATYGELRVALQSVLDGPRGRRSQVPRASRDEAPG
jgi:ribonuclease P protein component